MAVTPKHTGRTVNTTFTKSRLSRNTHTSGQKQNKATTVNNAQVHMVIVWERITTVGDDFHCLNFPIIKTFFGRPSKI